ncbi:MAG: LamG domain-containing protein, partial [Candidatus Marinimicrobia bacterium]|nr:LamG domain-containing protein [Candidatus Neomarinimicrobiota bacterium]
MALMTKSTDDPKVTRWWWRTLRQWIYELVDPLWAAFRGENSADISLTNVTGINGVSAAELTVLDGLTASTAELNKLSGLTADADELNKTDRAQADGIAEASKVATLDGNKDILGKRYDINQSLLDAQAGPPTFRFDGTDDHIQYDGNVLSGYPFTLWARFKTDSVSGAIVYFNDKDAGNIKFGINIDDNGKLVIQAQISASYSGVSVDAYNDGHWHTVFGLFRSDTDRELFVDGISVATSTNSQSYSAAIDRLSIGRLGDSTPSNYFQGEIDLVLVFNRALSTDEIKALASGGWPDHADRGASQTDLVTNGDDWTGASGSTPPNSWSDSGAGTASYLIRDNAGVANMDDKVLELDTVGGSKTLYQAILTTGKRYRVSFVYRNLEGSTPTYVAAGSANSKANLQHTLITGDGIIFSQEFTADGTDLMFVVDSG